MKIPRNHPELVNRLAADLPPVSQLGTPAMRALVWMVLPAALATWAVAGHLRADFAARLQAPAFLLELGLLAAGAWLSAWLAFRAAVPDRRVSGRALCVAVGVVAAATVILLLQPGRPPPMAGDSAARGLGCLEKTVALAGVPWLLVVLTLRRGGSVTPAASGALAGAAAFLLANVAMRLVCPNDAPAHVVTWHLLPVVAASMLSAALGAAWFGRWALSGRSSRSPRSL
jgi:hypothetical protein